MSSRDTVLGDVRKALGRQPGQAPQPLPAVRLRIPEMPLEPRITLFKERLEELGGKLHRADSLAAARDLVAMIANGRAVASNSAVLERMGIGTLPNVERFRDPVALREACSTAGFGITGADFGMAETGSLVIIASQEEARLISLLPPVHIAVLLTSRLLTGLDELFTRIPRPAEASSSMVFISGPSRSADIEMILVRGVHGPGVIHVILVEEDAG